MYVSQVVSLPKLAGTLVVNCLLVLTPLVLAPDGAVAHQVDFLNAGSRQLASPQPPVRYKTPLAEQRMAGGYWRTDHTFEPVLIVTNALENVKLPITPVLYAADGTEYDLPPVTIDAAGVYSIDIRAAVSAAPDEVKNHFSSYGSAAVKYVWHWPGAANAMVENRDAKRSLNFVFELRTPGKTHKGMAETVEQGMWWKEDPGVSGFLALTNIARHAVEARVQLLSNYGVTESETMVSLGPNETRTLQLFGENKRKSGGIQISCDGPDQDVAIAAGLENPAEGYSERVPFVPASQGNFSENVEVSSVGLMLGTPPPAMSFPKGTQFGIFLALRNTSRRPVSINPTLYYMDGSNVEKIFLNRLVLGARETKHWTPSELSKDLRLPNFNGMANVVFSYQGAPGDVIMASGSIDQSRNFVLGANMEGVGKTLSRNLKDWDVSNGNATMISLLNLDTIDDDLLVTFFYDGGQYKLPQRLKAGGSTTINVADIIAMQTPDIDGKTIPSDTQHGTAMLSGASTEVVMINVAASVGVLNVSTATCSGRCPNCTNYIDYMVTPFSSYSYAAPVNGSATFTALGLGSNGVWSNVNNLTLWSSSDPTVATSAAGTFHGVKVGSFNAIGIGNLPYGNVDCDGPEACPTEQYEEFSPGWVVSATFSQQTSGVVPTDNAARNTYDTHTATYNLGLIANSTLLGCVTGYETTATVSPNTFPGPVTIHRTLVNEGVFVNSGDVGGEKANVDDTSLSAYRDDDPLSGGSGGKVYDLDAVGTFPPVGTDIYRVRVNFVTYATLGDGRKITPNYSFYSRSSCQHPSSGWAFSTGIAGDNQVGAGTTKTTWNLQ